VKNTRRTYRFTSYRKLYQQFGAVCGKRLFIPHKRKRRSSMVMNTRSGSQTNREPRAPLEPVIQNNPQPPQPDADQDRIAALKAQIESLTQWNAELLRRRPEQPNPEMNRDEREEEDHNSNTNPRREDDRQGDLSRVIAELERRCTYMEMERKDKSRSIVVDKLLMGTDSPFTRRVADYRLPKKFKVPQILSYAGDGDPLDHLENFRAHLDLHGTPDEVACRAFPLTLSGNARDWFRKLPRIPLISSRSYPKYS
jgi:hypothetical protein